MSLEPQRLNVPIAGGLDTAETAEYLDPPGLFLCDNFYHNKRTGLTKRNGYDCDKIRVDIRTSQDPLQYPLNGIPTARFLVSEDPGVTFAAHGHLWSYEPDLYEDTSLSPVPNAIRQNQVPDLAVQQKTLVAMEVTPGAITDEYLLESASAVTHTGLLGVSYIRVTGGHFYEWHLLVQDLTTGATVSDTVMMSTTSTVLMHPTICATNRGLFACCMEYGTHELQGAFWDLELMQWAGRTLPKPNYYGVDRPLDWYDVDVLKTSTDQLIFAGIAAAGTVCDPVECVGEVGSVYVWKYSIIAGTNTAAIRAGKTEWAGLVAGDTANWPALAVCGNTTNQSYAVSWCNIDLEKTYFLSYTSADVTGTLITKDRLSSCVGVAMVRPNYAAQQAAWFFCLEFIDNENWDDTPGLERYSVEFLTMTANDTYLVRSGGVYFDAHIMSAPWSVNGAVYMLTRPGRQDTIQDWFFNDSPWILVRPWHDLHTNDYDPEYIQKPMGAWGYGTTFGITITMVGATLTTQRRFQPTRMHPDWNNSALTASGAVVCADPTNRGVGFTVRRLAFDPTGPDRYDSAPLPGGGSIFGCTNPWVWDGEDAFEAAFVHRPYVVSATATTAAGASLVEDTGTDRHFIYVVYEQVDARGRVTRSPLSELQTVQVTTGKTAIALVVKPVFFTARRSNTVKINVYMCRDAQNFGFVATALNPTLPVGSLDEDDITITITVEPTADSPLIYTADGSLESGYPGLAAHLIRWNNRIWIANEYTVSYTHQFIEGEQVQFPDTFTEVLDRYVTALTPLDDRMLLFSYDAVMYRSGEGPSPNGQGSSYSAWNFLTHEIGSVNSRSVFHTMVGVYFQSRRGLERMDDGGNFTHVREIEDYFVPANGDRIIGVLSLPRDHQARILYLEYTTLQLKQLVLDYSTNTWARFQQTHADVMWSGYFFGYSGDLTVVGDTVYMIDGQGYFYVERRGQRYDTYLPSTSSYHIDWTVSSPWIKLDGLQGFQRIWRTTIAFKVAALAPPVLAFPPGAMTVTLTTTGQPIPANTYTLIKCTNACTIGTTGGKYRISLDNGSTWGTEQTLGTATTITVAVPGGTITAHLTVGNTWALNGIIQIYYHVPAFGIETQFSYDYIPDNNVEQHDTVLADAIQAMRDYVSMVYLRSHHGYQQCRSVRVELSSDDATPWANYHDVTGVYEIDGIFCEYGIEPGTGRLQLGMGAQI